MPISQTGARMDTEADDYLNEWREVPLTFVADIRFSSVNKVSQPGEEPVRLCNYTDVYNNDYVTADMDFMRATATKSEIERFGLQIGDVIITKDSETPDDIGIPTVVDTTAPDLVCGYHLALLRPNQDEVDPTFLAKQLAHHRIARYFGQQANGTTRYGLSTAAISNAPLHLPRPESQRSASALMRMVDVQISQTEAVIAKLKKVRAGMLHDLLNYGLDEHGQLRDPIAHPEQFQDSPLGLIPREWDIFEISTVGEIVTGRTPPASEPGSWGMEIPFITPGEITTDGTVLPPERLISAHGRNFTRELPAYSVLVVCIGSTLGKVAVAPWPCVTNQQINAIICKADYQHDFVSAMVNHHIRQLHRWAGLQAVPIVNKSQFGRMLIPVAPPAEQVQIAETLQRGASSILSEIDECKKLMNFKYGFQDDLLTGLVRVPETIMEGAENA